MIKYDLDTATSVLTVHPESAFDKNDFAELAKTVDPHIESTGDLAGVIIDAAHFPGWDGFGAMVSHFRFVREHEKHVKKIAVVTDSHLGDVAEHLAIALRLRADPPLPGRGGRAGAAVDRRRLGPGFRQVVPAVGDEHRAGDERRRLVRQKQHTRSDFVGCAAAPEGSRRRSGGLELQL